MLNDVNIDRKIDTQRYIDQYRSIQIQINWASSLEFNRSIILLLVNSTSSYIQISHDYPSILHLKPSKKPWFRTGHTSTPKTNAYAFRGQEDLARLCGRLFWRRDILRRRNEFRAIAGREQGAGGARGRGSGPHQEGHNEMKRPATSRVESTCCLRNGEKRIGPMKNICDER